LLGERLQGLHHLGQNGPKLHLAGRRQVPRISTGSATAIVDQARHALDPLMVLR
jgi:hypothetical protein